MRNIISTLLIIGLALFVVNTTVFAAGAEEGGSDTVEVLHWWTSGGEAKALTVLKDDLTSKGITWIDAPVAGGGGTQAMTALRARVTSGDPPTAVQMLGFDILDWAELGVLANLNDTAEKAGWEAKIPDALKKFSKYNGVWIAAPVNVHSTNWVWANKGLLDELGIDIPQTWDDFVLAMEMVQRAGKVGLAHGGQAWQDATIFDGVVLSTGGPDFYEKAMINLDDAALRSSTMTEVFERMETLRSYVDDNFSGRDWNLASAMVIAGDAAFQIMGDWAKGEFLAADQIPNVDFVGFRVPGTQGSVTFNSDQFVMFEVGDAQKVPQGVLAEAIIDAGFQKAFNVVKGSVPARVDVSGDGFDPFGQKGIKDLQEANKNGTLLGSMAHGHAAPAAVKNALYDVVTAHFNGEYSSEQAVSELADAIARTK